VIFQNSAELARAAFAALGRRDLDGFLELVDPEVEFTSLIQESEAKLYCGHAGVRRFLDEMLGVFPDWHPEVERAESFGESALVKVRFSGTGSGSGTSVEQTAWQVAHARGGRVAGWRWFRTEGEARAALRQGASADEAVAAAGDPVPPGTRHRRP
jgi:ketosteroid isomerase-like protein